jgi:hypothetical protein
VPNDIGDFIVLMIGLFWQLGVATKTRPPVGILGKRFSCVRTVEPEQGHDKRIQLSLPFVSMSALL